MSDQYFESLMRLMSGDLRQVRLDDVVIRKYTDKNLLIEAHETDIQCQQNLQSLDNGFAIMRTATSIRSSTETKSLVSLHKKNCIAVTDLLKSIDKPITGKFLLCRSICPPSISTALATVADDPNGNLAVRIALYNFVRNPKHQFPKDVYQYLPVGSIIAIMNPWFKTTMDGGLSVRCDNPAEVKILSQSMVKEIFGNLTWKGQIPAKYRPKKLMPGDSVVDWKRSGNDYFVQKRYSEAIDAYTSGINGGKDDAIKLDLLANRSAAYLAIQKYKLSLIDANSVLDVKRNHIKCIFRKARALFGLAEYENALAFLNSVAMDALSKSDKKIVTDLVSKAESLSLQSKSGKYPWKDILQDKYDDIAEYVGPVIVKSTLTKGRGLFATGAINAGQLILASKAFARVVEDDNSPQFFSHMSMNAESGEKLLSSRSHTQLVSEIAHILKDNPEKCHEVYNLYAGPEFENRTIGTEIDLARIEAICFHNQFGSGLHFFMSGKNQHCGLWMTPSYINHSCIDGNSTWYQRGNFLFVFAFHDIAANEEIVMSYSPPSDKTAEELEGRGFVCDCRLCIRNLRDTADIRAQRSDLRSQLDAILNKHGDHQETVRGISDDEKKWTKILKSLQNLRKDAPDLDFCYVDKVDLLARIYCRNGQFLKSANILEKTYDVIANIPSYCQMTHNICTNIVGSYMALGRIDKVVEWVPILKRKIFLAYGTLEVIETLYPATYKIIESLGISLNEM
ncbi:Methyltransferase [Pseudolycoriella hygida]|uniref:Methyltransferase n=1 Tax=Pseudolycoriella hygida TaxID=35572 RepID=A0A9Q0N5D4_9DIPT|nr:Methyltransferase [Pseudolycoriella hygida]